MATVNSSLRTAQLQLSGGDLPIVGEVAGNLLSSRVRYTHTAGNDSTFELNLVKLPAGRVVIYPRLSHIRASQMATGADLHLGHRAYRNFNGTVVPADLLEWLDNVDIGGGAITGFWAAITGATGLNAVEYETRDGLELVVRVDTANIEDTDTIDLEVVYSHNAQ
jgi:hypothetical protein